MSIALMTMVRKTALPTNQKFALMALADWADDNGTSCWPSIYELSEYLTCSERTVQRLLRELEAGGWIVVAGNAHGGASSRRYCLNVPRMTAESHTEHERREAEKERRRRDRKAVESNPFLEGCQSVTPDRLSPVTNQDEGVTTATAGVTNQVKRGDTGVTLSTIEPPVIHQGTTSAPPPPAPAPAKKAKAESVDGPLQASCRETWAAYSAAYVQRYGVKPLRNAKVNAAIVAFVKRIGYEESPAVAQFYVANVVERIVLSRTHDTGLLLSNAEGYRTQWASGHKPSAAAMTPNKQEALEARNRAVAAAWVPPEMRAERQGDCDAA